jgi:hypothetical protein
MDIEYIIKNFKKVSAIKTSRGDDRLFFIDEENNHLYVFGPSSFIRKAFDKKDRQKIIIVEYENGPYLQAGDKIYGEYLILYFEVFEDHGIAVTKIILTKESKKKKSKKKTHINTNENIG